MKLVDVIRKVRKEYYASRDKIAAVKLVRKLTGQGLRESKDFFDWIHANGEGLSAPRLAGHWCEEHWQDNEICGCPSVEIADQQEQALAASTGASGGTNPLVEDALPEPIPLEQRAKPTARPKPHPTALALIEANKDRCPCGYKPCTDEFHANLSALIRKHGTSRAVELVWIAAGLKAPGDEEQTRFAETQPGYEPFYKEQQ